MQRSVCSENLQHNQLDTYEQHICTLPDSVILVDCDQIRQSLQALHNAMTTEASKCWRRRIRWQQYSTGKVLPILDSVRCDQRSQRKLEDPSAAERCWYPRHVGTDGAGARAFSD